MFDSKFKFIILLVATLVFFGAFLSIGTISASIMNYDAEENCLNNNYYWYDDTCYETKNEKLSAQVSGLQERISKLLRIFEERELKDSEQKEQEKETVLLLVEKALREGLAEELDTYSDDVKRELGFKTTIKTFPSSATVFEIENYIEEFYEKHKLDGVLLIGDLPTGRFYSDYYSGDKLPVYDYIYQDIYDACEYSEEKNAFNLLGTGCENSQIPPFWVSRLTPNSSKDSLSLLENYFKRNHEYRTGEYDYERNFLAYNPTLLGNDPEDRKEKEQSFKESLGEFNLYNQEHYTIIDPEKKNSDQLFLNELKKANKYEILTLNGHGTPTYHQKSIYSEDIENSNFFLGRFKSCSVGKFKTENYIVGKYLFEGRALTALAPSSVIITEVGGVDSKLHYLLSSGAPLFKALRIHSLGATNLFGDPTLKMRYDVERPDTYSPNDPSITLSPSSLSFTNNQGAEFTIKNTGGSKLEFKFYPKYYKVKQKWNPSYDISGWAFVDTNKYGHYLLEPGEEATFEIKHSEPLEAPEGKYQGEIFILSNDPVKPSTNIPFEAEVAGTQGSIAITSPEKGDQWKRKSTHEITWNSSLPQDRRVEISISDGGNKIATVAQVNNTGSYSWKVGKTKSEEKVLSSGKDYKIKICSLSDSSVCDTSDSFSITPQDCHTSDLWSWDYCSTDCKCEVEEGDCDKDEHCITGYCAYNVGKEYDQSSSMDVCEEKEKSITVTSPNGGEQYHPGDIMEITWNSENVEEVIIKLTDYSYSSEISPTIANAKEVNASSGEYDWTIPENFPQNFSSQLTENWNLGDNFKIFIAELEDSGGYGIQDEGDDYFTIESKTQECTNSDGGKNYYEKGTVEGMAGDDVWTTDTDRCQNSQELVEWFCLDEFKGKENVYRSNNIYNCPNGCKDGACIERREPPCDSYGDVNNDNYVTLEDKDVLTQTLEDNSWKSWSWAKKSRADVDNSGEVEQQDAELIARYYSELDSNFPVCKQRRKPPCQNYGDVYEDGYVTTQDAMLAARIVTGLESGTQQQEERIDVDGDGELEVDDYIKVADYAQQEVDTFPVCSTSKLEKVKTQLASLEVLLSDISNTLKEMIQE